MDHLMEEFERIHDRLDEFFEKSEKNSLFSQVCELSYYFAIFHMIQAARSRYKESENGDTEQSSLLHGLINHGFFGMTIMGIRRLVDENERALSLIQIIIFIEKNQHIITRRRDFKHQNIEYDLDAIRKRRDIWRERTVGSREMLRVPQECDCGPTQDLHTFWDQLSRTEPNTRSYEDVISKSLLASLKAKLTESKKVAIHAHSNIAHAQRMPRSEEARKKMAVTYGQIKRAFKEVCEVYYFVFKLVTGSGTLLVPTIYENPNRFLDRPIAASDDLELLEQTWRDFEAETMEWREWDWKSLA